MINTSKTAIAHYIEQHRKEVRLALLLLALAVLWLGANHINSFFAGFFDGAAGM